MLSNIHKCKKGEKKRYYCNGGTQDTNQIGDLAGSGTVYYNSQSIANILSLGSVVKQRRVIFDSADGNVLKVRWETTGDKVPTKYEMNILLEHRGASNGGINIGKHSQRE